MTDVLSLSTLVVLLSQIFLDVTSGHPVAQRIDDTSHKILNRFERSLQSFCARKKHLRDKNGTIVVNSGYTHYTRSVSCSWKIHIPRRPAFHRSVHLGFSKFNIEDSCPGICQCNYVAVERQGRTNRTIEKFCNENKPPAGLMYPGNKVRIHLRLKAPRSPRKRISFQIKYTAMYTEKTTKSGSRQQSDKDIFDPSNHFNDASKVRVRKLVPSDRVNVVTRTVQPTQDPGPSKLTILLAVAVPVVLIFILVVLLIAYYNYYIDKKEKEGGEDVPNNGTTISDMILNSSVTLAPMFNLKKARRESSVRREKANKLYDDMLQNWRQMNANKKKREKAKEESVNTWESYKKYKQRRNTRDVGDANSEAFAMLVSNAINVATNPSPPAQDTEASTQPDINETIEEVEEKPRNSSILVRRNSSNDIRDSRGSKVLSWADISTSKPKDEDNTTKRTKSETELKIISTESGESAHIPAIVVSQPSIETEDDESEANDTDRLIKDDKEDNKKSNEELNQAKNAAKTYSCSEHVKDILRESYGDEVEEWFQKPQKSQSQSSLHHVPESNVKYQAMKTTDDDDDID